MANDVPSGEQYLAAIAHRNIERIEHAAQMAIQAGYVGPTVLLFDLTSPTALRIAATSGRNELIADCIARAELNGVIPVVISHIAGSVAGALLEELGFSPDDFPPLLGTRRFHLAVVGRDVSAIQTLELPA